MKTQTKALLLRHILTYVSFFVLMLLMFSSLDYYEAPEGESFGGILKGNVVRVLIISVFVGVVNFWITKKLMKRNQENAKNPNK